jgi:transcriptional regulator of acetoin/glycerol metabolism
VESASSTLTFSDGRPRRGATPARPQLYLVLACDRPLLGGARFSLADVDAVTIGRGSELTAQRLDEAGLRRLRLQLPDRWVSGTHAHLTKVLGRWVIEDAGSKNGTLVNGELCSRSVLSDGDLVEIGHTIFLYRDAVPTAATDPADVIGGSLQPAAPGLATLVPALARDLELLVEVARSPVSVVLRGESGTGKEVVARAIHQLSQRPGTLVATNCGALPDNILETELFGYRKGAFSGADEDRPGLIRAADRGTLLLDEIGDLPAASQAAFLRVLQEREVMPVGGTRPVKVDLRLVAATHRDLEALVEEGRFRQDLFARITGFSLLLPPLRERREDLGLLVAALIRRTRGDQAEQVSFRPEAARALLVHDWPMNIRELEKALGTAVVLARGAPVDLEHLPEAVQRSLREGPKLDEAEDARPLTSDETRHREELVALLEEHGGNVSAVARKLGKARMQIQRWIKRYRIDPESFRR